MFLAVRERGFLLWTCSIVDLYLSMRLLSTVLALVRAVLLQVLFKVFPHKVLDCIAGVFALF